MFLVVLLRVCACVYVCMCSCVCACMCGVSSVLNVW